MRAVHVLLADDDNEPVRRRIRLALGSDIEVTTGSMVPAPGSSLLLAPHVFDQAAQRSILRRHDWRSIHLSSAGYDFFSMTDVPRDAWVTRSWRAYAAPLAEYVLRALLRHAWDAAGSGLRGRQVGVVGYGEVGRRVVDILALLEARTIVLRRSGAAVHNAAATNDVRDLLAVQHLVLTVPLNRDSEGMIGRGFLTGCSPGLHLVNVSRGELIDQEALLEAVQRRDVWATLDVTVPEPLPARHPLRLEDHVHITDHIAWHSGADPYCFVDDFLEVWTKLRRGDEPSGLLRRPLSA